MSLTITPRLARTAGESAKRSSIKFERDSQLVESSAGTRVRQIEQSDIQIGNLLGKGGFSNVNEVVLKSKDGTSDDRVYAIKYLRNSVMRRRESLKIGAADLVVESKILSHVSHPNIVSLHGISSTPLVDSYKHNHRFFLVLDILTCSLEEKLIEWSIDEDMLSRQKLLPRFGISEDQKTRLYERMNSVAIPVANAVKYLHEKNIILRDLKPGNIGFQGDTVKLFDFGMAREIKDDGRRLTGNTGSPLYMAPEVALCKDYGLEADIYSFAYVMWELATLKIPFDGITREKHTRKILVDDARPRVDNRCGSARIQQLITDCWSRSPKSRPAPLEILRVLNVETNKRLGEAKTVETRARRRVSPIVRAKLPLARAA